MVKIWLIRLKFAHNKQRRSRFLSTGQSLPFLRILPAHSVKYASRSVSRVLYGGGSLLRVTAIHLGRLLPAASSNQPGQEGWSPSGGKPPIPPLFGFAPGGVCHAAPVAGRAVRSYRTFSPLPSAKAKGGIFSVALSLRSPPPDIIRHRFSMEPGLSSRLATRGRPTDWHLSS